jgi:8-hydroxy-5-deazaflavin:NADPH oxidoreductase
MRIGIIGAGNVARAITHLLTPRNHEVILSNSRGPSSLAALAAELGPQVTAGTVADAAEAELAVLAVPWQAVPSAVSGLPPWKDRIVIDATNQYVSDDGTFKLADLGGRTSSEIVAGMLPGARVVKAFNTVPAAIFERPREAGGRRVLFVSGDDDAAKRTVRVLLDELGFAPIDLGSLGAGGAIQQAGGPLGGKNLIMLSAR